MSRKQRVGRRQSVGCGIESERHLVASARSSPYPHTHALLLARASLARSDRSLAIGGVDGCSMLRLLLRLLLLLLLLLEVMVLASGCVLLLISADE